MKVKVGSVEYSLDKLLSISYQEMEDEIQNMSLEQIPALKSFCDLTSSAIYQRLWYAQMILSKP